jgi:hypothetical protein
MGVFVTRLQIRILGEAFCFDKTVPSVLANHSYMYNSNVCREYHREVKVTSYTAMTLLRKFETNIPRNETALPRSQSYFGERFVYSHERSAYSAAGK